MKPSQPPHICADVSADINFREIWRIVRELDAALGGTVKMSGAGGSRLGVTDHGALTGLGDDDHIIYVLLAGRAGGQTITGPIIWTHNDYPGTIARRTTAVVNSSVTTHQWHAKTSGNMADGFGPSMDMVAEDDVSGPQGLAAFKAIRDGADNTGRFIVTVQLAGVNQNVLAVNSDGSVEVDPDASYGSGFKTLVSTAQTTDATITDLASVAVAEGDVWLVEAQVIGRKSDGSQRALYHLEGLFYRNVAGNVTQQGATTGITAIESDANWDCTLNADIGTQSIDVRVTGVAGTIIDWKAALCYFRVT